MSIYQKSFILLDFRSLELKKKSSAMVWHWKSFYPKSFIFVRFKVPKLKISSIMIYYWIEFLSKILHAGAFQISWIENFLQPWWRTFNTALKIVHSNWNISLVYIHIYIYIPFCEWVIFLDAVDWMVNIWYTYRNILFFS